LRFHPVYQSYIWGGDKLRRHLGRTDTPTGKVAESWEISDRADGMSVVSEGPLAGKSLRELIQADSKAVLGDLVSTEVFPLLIKLLDADQTLSVQVHPNDETAAKFGGEAKTESWYILEAERDACVYCGLEPGVTAESFRRAIEENRLEPLLKKIPVQAGDAIFVPGGRVHAIASGCLLLEVQQNSNTTYRIYDWGRVDDKGKGRELHIDQALEVSILEEEKDALTPPKGLNPLAGMAREQVMRSPWFLLERLRVSEDAELPANPQSFQVLFAIDGDVKVSSGGETVQVPAGASVFLPAAAGEAGLHPIGGTVHVMRITVPE
jgi:mannose-6-phosphate isomerase